MRISLHALFHVLFQVFPKDNFKSEMMGGGKIMKISFIDDAFIDDYIQYDMEDMVVIYADPSFKRAINGFSKKSEDLFSEAAYMKEKGH